MTTKSETSKAIDRAFGAALLLTGSTEVAENSVLDGIAALEFGHIVDDVLLVETVKSAIQRRADFPGQSEQAPSHLPLELRRLFLLAPISRDCFVLRVLLAIPRTTCSAVLSSSTVMLSKAFSTVPQVLELVTEHLNLLGHFLPPNSFGRKRQKEGIYFRCQRYARSEREDRVPDPHEDAQTVAADS